MALVGASGSRGLSAFIPDGQRSHSVARGRLTRQPNPAPILPLTDTWQAADFSLDSVLSHHWSEDGDFQLRPFTLRLLSRYLYMTGE